MKKRIWSVGMACVMSLGAATAATAADTAAEDGIWAKGIPYLLNAQEADGSWGQQRGKAGITGLVLESLVLAPEKFQDDNLAAARVKAAEYIAACQQTEKPYDGAVFENADGAKSVSVYSTSIAIVALVKQDREKYLPHITKAVDWLKRQQAAEDAGFDREKNANVYGGFAYGVEGGPRGSRADLSNTWMALDALKASGLVADDDPVWERARVFVKRAQHSTESNDMPWASDDLDQLGSGVYVLSPNPRSGEAPHGYGSMTYAALLSFLWLDMTEEDKPVKLAREWLERNYSVEEHPRQGQNGIFYYYRLMAKALTAIGVDEIAGHDWRAEVAAELAKRQQADGSFKNDADRWGESDPTLATGYALATLGLARVMPDVR